MEQEGNPHSKLAVAQPPPADPPAAPPAAATPTASAPANIPAAAFVRGTLYYLECCI